jgi:2'-5' RNA ligase
MRLFVGLDFPWETKQLLASLAGGIPGARWVPPENYHMTLRFIGEMPAHRAEEIDHEPQFVSLRADAGGAFRAFQIVAGQGGVGVHARGGICAPVSVRAWWC